MLTRAQIEAAEKTFDYVAKRQFVAAVRFSSEFRANAERYSDLETRLDYLPSEAVQMVNAGLAILEDYGDGTIAIKGGADGNDYSLSRDREALIQYLLAVVYELSPTVPTGYSFTVPVKYTW